MHYRIFSILVTFVCLFCCVLTTGIAQNATTLMKTRKAGHTYTPEHPKSMR